jgi:hypothetical protein
VIPASLLQASGAVQALALEEEWRQPVQRWAAVQLGAEFVVECLCLLAQAWVQEFSPPVHCHAMPRRTAARRWSPFVWHVGAYSSW